MVRPVREVFVDWPYEAVEDINGVPDDYIPVGFMISSIGQGMRCIEHAEKLRLHWKFYTEAFGGYTLIVYDPHSLFKVFWNTLVAEQVKE